MAKTGEFTPLRKLIANNTGFCLLRVCGEDVFAQAVVNTVVFVLQKGIPTSNIRIEREDETWQLSTETWMSDPLLAVDYRLREGSIALITKIRKASQPLSEFGEAIQGITPYDRYRGQSPDLIKRRGYHFRNKHDKHCGKWLSGKDIARYNLDWGSEWLKYGPWLGAPREPHFFEGPRLLLREIPGKDKRIQATLVNKDIYYHGHSITPVKLHESSVFGLRFLLGIVNSRITSWFGGLTLPNFGKEIFPKLNPKDVKGLPVPRIELNDPKDKFHHDKIVALVDSMLNLNAKLSTLNSVSQKETILHQIKATDAEIDNHVYDLYGLTEKEIAIVEGDNP